METVTESLKTIPLKISSYHEIRQVGGVRGATRNRATRFLMFACCECAARRRFGFAVGPGERFNAFPLLKCESCRAVRLHEYVGVGR